MALLYRTSLGAAAAAVLLFLGVSRFRTRVVPAMALQQNFMVQWCNADQVAAMLEGNLSRGASITIRPGTSVLHVMGRPSDLRVVRSMLDQYDNGNGSCAAMAALAAPTAAPMTMPVEIPAGAPAAASRVRAAKVKFQMDAARAAAARP